MKTGHWQSSQGGRRFRNHWQSGGGSSPGPGPDPDPVEPVFPDYYWFYGTQCAIWIDKVNRRIRIIPAASNPTRITNITVPETYTGDIIPIIAINTDNLPILTDKTFSFGKLNTNSFPWVKEGTIQYTAEYYRAYQDEKGVYHNVKTEPFNVHVLYITRLDLIKYTTRSGNTYTFTNPIDLYSDLWWDLPDDQDVNIGRVTRTAHNILTKTYDLKYYSIYDMTYVAYYKDPVVSGVTINFPIRYGVNSVVTPKFTTYPNATFAGYVFGLSSYDSPVRGAYKATVYNDNRRPEGIAGELAGFDQYPNYGAKMTYNSFIIRKYNRNYSLNEEFGEYLMNWKSEFGDGLSFGYSDYGNCMIAPPCYIDLTPNVEGGRDFIWTQSAPIPLVIESGWTT